MADERLRNLKDQARLPRGAGEPDEPSRDEPRGESDDLRIEAYRARQFQHVLPDLPKIPGFAVMWVSMENPNDVRQRLADGYTWVTPGDIPHWEFPGMHEGNQPGTINVREMRAAKLPMRLWNAYMTINHHERPLEDDSKLIARIDQKVGGSKSLEVEEAGEASGIQEIREGLKARSPWR